MSVDFAPLPPVPMRVVHSGRSTCNAISGRGGQSTGIPDCCPLTPVYSWPPLRDATQRTSRGFLEHPRNSQSIGRTVGNIVGT